MKVWIVELNGGNEVNYHYIIDKVFDTEEKSKKYIKSLNLIDDPIEPPANITEIEVE